MMRLAVIGLIAGTMFAAPVFAQDTLPDGPGKAQTVAVCSVCHEAQKAASVKLTRKGWTDTIEKMKALGAQGSDADFAAILEYLSTNFKGEVDEPLDLNSAEAIDLESVLQLLRKESAAFIQFRSKRGPFKSLADLKELDPAIVKKIESHKDRIVFAQQGKP